MKLPRHGRYDYVPIHKRPQYEWPGGTRLAVCFNNNRLWIREDFPDEFVPSSIVTGRRSTSPVSRQALNWVR